MSEYNQDKLTADVVAAFAKHARPAPARTHDRRWSSTSTPSPARST